MKISETRLNGRQGWRLDNDTIGLTMLKGGGHIASVVLNEKPDVNPMWTPVWQPLEPWQFKPRDKDRYGLRLLAGICGHNLCLGWFGDPSPEEARAGMETHGEAPVARWKATRKTASQRSLALSCACELPVAQMTFERTLKTRKGSNIVSVTEKIRNTSRRDLPFTMCQHVTLGPPFLEKGVTVFDMPATEAHTFPGPFGPVQRLRPDTAFTWPVGPGPRGRKVDMRTIGTRDETSSDFSAQLMDPAREDAWFSALNPRLGVLIAYIWKRADFPWIGNWEENYARKEAPWAGKSLTRGMEFTNTPFPIGLRRAVDMATFHNQPTYRWLPARSAVTVEYAIVIKPVPETCTGVVDIRRRGSGFSIDLTE